MMRWLSYWLLITLMMMPLSAFAISKQWDFRVTLDNHNIGEHRYSLESDGKYLKLNSDASFDYRVLFFSVFRYVHHDVEYWKDDCLNKLSSNTRTNGKHEEVKARRVDDQLHVEHAGEQDDYAGCVKSFAYWNPDFLKETHLLNSQTGEYMPVSIKKVAKEFITVKGMSELADRYHIQGHNLSIDLWYVNDEWVALQATTAGGRLLRYELK